MKHKHSLFVRYWQNDISLHLMTSQLWRHKQRKLFGPLGVSQKKLKSFFFEVLFVKKKKIIKLPWKKVFEKKFKTLIKEVQDVRSVVNFINILHMCFLYKNKLSSFSRVMFGSVIFWHQNIGAKCTRKMLMKFPPVVDF